MFSFSSSGATQVFNTNKEWYFTGPYSIIPINNEAGSTNVLVRGLNSPNRIEMLQDTGSEPEYNKTYTGMGDYDIQAIDQDTIFTEHRAISYTGIDVFTYTNNAHFLALGKKYLYSLPVLLEELGYDKTEIAIMVEKIFNRNGELYNRNRHKIGKKEK